MKFYGPNWGIDKKFDVEVTNLDFYFKRFLRACLKKCYLNSGCLCYKNLHACVKVLFFCDIRISVGSQAFRCMCFNSGIYIILFHKIIYKKKENKWLWNWISSLFSVIIRCKHMLHNPCLFVVTLNVTLEL